MPVLSRVCLSALLATVLLLASLPSTRGQDVIQIGGQTGAQIFFDSTRARTFNFGITTTGGSSDLALSNILVFIKKDAGVTNPVVVTIYDNFGGTGNVIATGSLAATNFTSQFDGRYVPLNTNVLLGAGAYSLVLTSDTTADRYFYKASKLSLQTTNGIVLSSTLWTQDSNENGTAGTSLQTTTPILADFMVSTTNVNFGNYRVGSSVTTNVTLTNTAFFTSNNLTESLVTATSTTSAATVSGLSTNFLAATNRTNFNVGISTVNVGTNNGAVILNYTSVTNGSASTRGAATNIGSQSIAVTGVGYRLADDAVSATNIAFGNFRLGLTTNFTTNVAVTNTAANDGFSERLGVSNSATTGAATITNLPGSLIAAGGTTNVTVGLNTSNAGTNSGTVTLGFNSSGVGTSGFAATNIGTTNINVVAVGYRLADDALSTTNVNLGNFRIVNGAGTGTVTLSNTATADGFSEGLGVVNSGTTGGATVTNVPGTLIAAGGNSIVTVGLGTANAGTNSGTVTFGFDSDGAGTSGFGATNIGSQAVNVVGVGYRLASESVSTTNLNLGRFHIGYNTNMGSLSGTVGVTNTSTGDGFSEGLAVADDGTVGGATVSGIPGGLIAAGANANITVGLGSVSAVGANAGTLTLGFQSSGTGTSGFSATNIGTQVVNVTAQGYSGQAIWNADAGGSWNDFDNWDVPGGAPGIDGVLLSTNDQATFGSTISSARTVNLDGQSPVLTLLSFSNASASYTVARGSGGSIILGTLSHQTPVLNNAAGDHTVSVGVTLAYATQADISTNSTLTISGALDGTQNLGKIGAGTLAITGTGNLSGNTTVDAGTLKVNGSIAASDVTVNSGALLTGSGSVGGIVMNLGGTVNPGNSPGTIYATDVLWNGGANYNWQISDAATNNTPGTTWDLISASGTLDLGALSETNRFNINLWTLSGVAPDTNGPVINFNSTQSYRWTILSASGGIVGGFAMNKFNVYLAAINGTGGWANDLGGGSLYLDVLGNNLDLVFDPNVGPEPIPEPSTWVAAALLLGAAAYVRWRRRSKAAA